MIREDYLQYYIQGSEHYLIPKDIFDELFTEMKNWKKEAHQYKEIINKALNLNEKITNMRGQGFSYEQYKPYLLKQQNILKEVEHE